MGFQHPKLQLLGRLLAQLQVFIEKHHGFPHECLGLGAGPVAQGLLQGFHPGKEAGIRLKNPGNLRPVLPFHKNPH